MKLFTGIWPMWNWDEKVAWCEENLYHGGHYEPNWYLRYPWIEFDNEQDYVWFTLRWL